ncbi:MULTISPECIES: VOC family protein [Streptomyces]|uniref:VOC family protein n=1 Tax=Streptomyces lichenis TaxID=2306967 RepID=A0ABT0IDE1_9ACTN|nr:VOC family protein [Streptomyces lichenis]MCK8679346.1 VOC family protein [Streptomyces lichenis]
MEKIRPCLWYDGEAEAAVDFYVSLFPDSEVQKVTRYTEAGPGEPGSVLTIEFALAGRQYTALNGGPEFRFNEAVSLSVDCGTQEEVDELWNRFLAGGGEESVCGWLKDRWGLSWQIVPTRLVELLDDPDPDRVARVFHAMLKMRKLDVATLEAA